MRHRVLVAGPLLAAGGLAVWLACFGPDMVETPAKKAWVTEQDNRAYEGAAAVATEVQRVVDVLNDPSLRRATRVGELTDPGQLREALQQFTGPVLQRLGAVLFLHDRHGRVSAVSPALDPAMTARFEAHEHSQAHGQWEAGEAGVCPKCYDKLGMISVTSPLDGGRFLVANLPVDSLTAILAAQAETEGRRAWLEADGITIPADADQGSFPEAGPPEADDAAWLTSRAPVVGPAAGWRVVLSTEASAAAGSVGAAANRLLVAAGGVVLLIIVAGIGLACVQAVRRRDDLDRAAALAHHTKLATLGGMSARVGHELRNALTGLSVNLELAAMEVPPDSETSAMLQDSIRSSHRIARIADDLRAFSRRDDDDFIESPLMASVEDALRLSRHSLGSGPTVTLEAEADPFVRQIPGQLCHVLVNLVKNAAEATDEATQKPIVVRVCRAGDTAKVSVTDHGSGIPEHVLPELFVPFFTTKGREQGTGLGLAISAEIVKRHGGSLRAENLPDGGARFVLELPCAELAAHGA